MYTPLSSQQARVMLDLQAAMNSKVDPAWLEAAYPYLRAVVVESAEAIEHHGWKWWKKQTLDLPQLQMEIIDIWHFLLSELLLRNQGDVPRTLDALLESARIARDTVELEFDNRRWDLSQLDLVSKLELLTAVSAVRRIELGLFISIMTDCQLSWAELYQQYVGKNVLNFFRQDHGYKDGSYRKEWHGREDNEHLVEVMAEIPVDDGQYPGKLYAALKSRYSGS
tara:strand:+ start:4564 stop:5235 length:672 start_codon:yes stop_codon:yes gene_type:complete